LTSVFAWSVKNVNVTFGIVFCCAASAFGQAGAPTQRVKIPGIPDGTSIYAKAPHRGSDFTSVGCVSKTSDGGFQITDWRGAGGSNGAGAPAFEATKPLVLRLQGDTDMLNFHVGHEVEVRGPILADAKVDRPAEIKAESLLYLSRTCWKRGTNTADADQPRR
jgi:hypothetical protein